MNPATGAISPQYHLVHDDHFSTVYSDGIFDADVWDSLVVSNLERHIDCPETSDGTPTVPLPSHLEPTISNLDAELQRMFNKFASPSDLVDSPAKTGAGGTDFPDLPFPAPPLPSDSSSNLPSAPEGDSSPSEGDISATEAGTDGNGTAPEESHSPPLRRSTRVCKPVERLTFLSSLYSIYNTMFSKSPTPSGSRQTSFHGLDQPSRISNEKLNQ